MVACVHPGITPDREREQEAPHLHQWLVSSEGDSAPLQAQGIHITAQAPHRAHKEQLPGFSVTVLTHSFHFSILMTNA